MSIIEIIDTQTDIIRLQAGIIDSLYMRLSQLMATDELTSMPELNDMKKAVETTKEAITWP